MIIKHELEILSSKLNTLINYDIVKVYLKSNNLEAMNEAGDIMNNLKRQIPNNLLKGYMLTICFPQLTKRYCLLRSPHVNKKSREHFSSNIIKRSYHLFHQAESIDVLKELSNLNFPPGVSCYIEFTKPFLKFC